MATVFPLVNGRLDAVSIFTLDRLGFLATAALFAIVALRDPVLPLRFGRIEGMMVLYLAVVVTSWLLTIPEKSPVDLKRDLSLILSGFIMPFTAFVVGRHAGWNAEQRRTAIAVAVAAIGAYLVAVGIIQAAVDWRFLVAPEAQDFHSRRARGPFPNAVLYAAVLATHLPSALVLRQWQPPGWRRLLLTVLCVGIFEAVLLSQVRIVWAALPIGLLYLAAVSRPMRRTACLGALGFVVLVGVAAIGLDLSLIAGPNGALRRPGGAVGERLTDDGPVFNRVAVYSTALNMVAHRPLLGFGFGAHTFESERADYYASCCGVPWQSAVECAVPHNELLNQLVLLGAVGLAAYLVLMATLWRTLGGADAGGALAAALVAAVQTAFIMLAITAQLHDVMYLVDMQPIFFFFAGVIEPGPTDARSLAAAVAGLTPSMPDQAKGG
jgi:O-antigen ligase